MSTIFNESLNDHSFHNFDVELWLNNFEDLTEPEYVVNSLDDLILSDDSEELRALLKKDGTLDIIVAELKEADITQLFKWIIDPTAFIKSSEVHVDDDRYFKLLSELIPGIVLYKNKWDRNQLGIEFRNFVNLLNEPSLRKNSRLKKCEACGYNLSDLFAMHLTADHILDDKPVVVTCPHCNVVNYIKF